MMYGDISNVYSKKTPVYICTLHIYKKHQYSDLQFKTLDNAHTHAQREREVSEKSKAPLLPTLLCFQSHLHPSTHHPLYWFSLPLLIS